MKLLLEYLKSLTPEELAGFASMADTSTGYLWQVAYGRKRIGPEFALRLESASGKRLPAHKLCPDFPWDKAASPDRCRACLAL
jgi:DNA-binding transcriptional regulator YdaS (Cro superfamily)